MQLVPNSVKGIICSLCVSGSHHLGQGFLTWELDLSIAWRRLTFALRVVWDVKACLSYFTSSHPPWQVQPLSAPQRCTDFSVGDLAGWVHHICCYGWLPSSSVSSLMAKSIHFTQHPPQDPVPMLAIRKLEVLADWLCSTGEGRNWAENRNWLHTLF